LRQRLSHRRAQKLLMPPPAFALPPTSGGKNVTGGNRQQGRSQGLTKNQAMPHFPHAPHAKPHGFTLIELMVVVAIAGILAAVAYPAYTSHIQRSRRADAVAVLTAVVQAQERYRSNRNAYASDATGEGGATALETLGIDVSKITKNYSVSVSKLTGAPDYSGGYTVTAKIKSSGAQSGDSQCTDLVVTLFTATLTYSAVDAAGADSTSKCWVR
jgi:type IV pilus assembly protein PilE